MLRDITVLTIRNKSFRRQEGTRACKGNDVGNHFLGCCLCLEKQLLPRVKSQCSMACGGVTSDSEPLENPTSWKNKPRGSKALNNEYWAQTIVINPYIES